MTFLCKNPNHQVIGNIEPCCVVSEKPKCDCGAESTHIISVPNQHTTGICTSCWNIATSKESLKEWKDELKNLPGWDEFGNPGPVTLDYILGKNNMKTLNNFIENLLTAQSLISYEKGREEQRKEILEKIDNFMDSLEDGDQFGANDLIQFIKLIHPSPDAK